MTGAAPTAHPPQHAVILCHPDANSFNAAIAQRYCDTVRALGHDAVLRDLYRLGFDPVLKAKERPTEGSLVADDVAKEIEILGRSDVIVLVYPIWFGMPPAMMKGYVDRVMGAGFPFRAIRDRATHRALTGKRMLSFTTSGTSKQWLEEQGAWLSLRHLFDDYLKHAFSLAAAEHIHFSSIVPGLDGRFVNEHLREVEDAARNACSFVQTHSPT